MISEFNFTNLLTRLQVIENAEDFQSAVDEFESWLPRVSSVVQQFGPISSDPKEIKKQLKEAEASQTWFDLFNLFKTISHYLGPGATEKHYVVICFNFWFSSASNKGTFQDILLVELRECLPKENRPLVMSPISAVNKPT